MIGIAVFAGALFFILIFFGGFMSFKVMRSSGERRYTKIVLVEDGKRHVFTRCRGSWHSNIRRKREQKQCGVFETHTLSRRQAERVWLMRKAGANFEGICTKSPLNDAPELRFRLNGHKMAVHPTKK